MQFEGAIIREQQQTFAVVIVKRHVIENQNEANTAIRNFSPAFPGMPVVLMAQDARGTPTYFGRKDIARYLASVPLQSIPWSKFTLN